MITTHDKIKVLKTRAEDINIPLKDKMEIIEFFKKYNDIFYYQININSFFKDLDKLTKGYLKDGRY